MKKYNVGDIIKLTLDGGSVLGVVRYVAFRSINIKWINSHYISVYYDREWLNKNGKVIVRAKGSS